MTEGKIGIHLIISTEVHHAIYNRSAGHHENEC